MKITGIRTKIVWQGCRNGVFTAVDTDAGLVGYSEVVMKRKSRAIEAHIHELERTVLGRDPTCIEDIFEKMYRDSFWVGGPMSCTAMSAIDIALWDLLGKSLRVPVYKLLGGPCRDEILVYAHCPGGSTPQRFAENARACVARGFRAFKATLPLFYGGQGEGATSSGTRGVVSQALKETEYLPTDFFPRAAEFFRAARDAVGDGVEIALDCHGRLNVANSVRLCEALQPFRLLFIEEPVPPENPDSLYEIARHTTTPLAAGERMATIYEAKRLLEKPCVAHLQCDVTNCGGITQYKKIAALAEAYYVGVSPHNPNGPLSTAASVQVCAAVPNFTILETIGSAEDEATAARLLRNPLKIENGIIRLSQEPGLGVDVNWDEIERAPEYRPFAAWR